MIELYVSGQNLRIYTPVVAADSLNYLTVQVWFLGSEWDGYSRWVHFRKGEGPGAQVYDLILDSGDRITEDKSLNLTSGEWTVYLTGVREGSRLTTAPVIITVKESGLVDAPLHEMPLSVAEQIANDAAQALAAVRALRADAESGRFNGRDGTSFMIAGYYESEEELTAAVTDPAPGEAYAVGTRAPYEIYIWDALSGRWVNNGPMQGAKGDAGDAGATFRPSIDADGNLSWTNDGGLENPTVRNIRGPAGRDGAAGPAGASAFAAAAEAGFQGTEATFNAALAAMPSHASRHLPDGADPLTVKTGNLENGAVTEAKLAANAVSALYGAELSADAWQGSEAPYTQSVALPGLRAADTPLVDVALSGTYTEDRERLENFARLYRATAAQNSLNVWASARPTAALPIRILCVRK